ncbi:rubrerythrin family protein [Lacrimispora sp. AGF001]|uniref:rubrerythrin family protein n=1 Tax=Lacrimispora sp. AGF001 TaxID=3401631 RepID=UPI003B4354F8|nr:rubrerythrin family protein [Paenibacillaceae bacterium]
MDFTESRTYKNLGIAFNAEAIASTRDRIFADVARQEGYIEIGNIYEINAQNNLEHARIWFRQLNQGILPNTEEALMQSRDNELNLANKLYQDFARTAREEGFLDIAALFAGIANIDYNQGTRFSGLLRNVVQKEVFCKPSEALWICMQCGNIMSGECAPLICPVCDYPQGYYRLYNDNF